MTNQRKQPKTFLTKEKKAKCPPAREISLMGKRAENKVFKLLKISNTNLSCSIINLSTNSLPDSIQVLIKIKPFAVSVL